MDDKVTIPSYSLTGFEVTVGSPEKVSEGVVGYVQYTVHTNVARGVGASLMQQQIQFEHEKRVASVIRRFSDFVSFHNVLCDTYPFLFIPMLPDRKGIQPTFCSLH
jgi:hypothetical protein